MTRGDLIERLSKYEWSDVEFKEARNAAPRSAYETVSAFANTSEGWLVFGLSHRTFFRRKRLDPLLRAGMIRMTRPDEPNHPDQAYVVTEARLAFLHEWRTEVGRKEDP